MTGLILLDLKDNIVAMQPAGSISSIYGSLVMAQLFELDSAGGESINIDEMIYPEAIRRLYNKSR
jgi:hypothetical protein